MFARVITAQAGSQGFDNAIGLAEDEAVRRFLLERRNA